ncbi:hypothetical protein F750_0325 [Streptomyces sp. PAMC 26508]|nr:hypothetical protein F750_0325 [Streptomyces sp. PAMC 26508]
MITWDSVVSADTARRRAAGANPTERAAPAELPCRASASAADPRGRVALPAPAGPAAGKARRR